MKTLSLKLTLALLLGWSTTSMAADEVRLLRVTSSSAIGYGRVEVLVANLAYQKKVSLHIRQGATWTDFPLTYDREANAGREVWSANFNPANISAAANLRFAIKYVVNNQTYWDNNNGVDYTINKNGGTLLGNFKGNAVTNNDKVNVYNGNPQPHVDIVGASLNGFITVRNIAAIKDVKVYYTTDGWASSQIVNAAYFPGNFWPGVTNPNLLNFEEWTFSLNVGNVSAPNPAKTVEYAIRYVVGGQTYWDNNFGFNYRTVVY